MRSTGSPEQELWNHASQISHWIHCSPEAPLPFVHFAHKSSPARVEPDLPRRTPAIQTGNYLISLSQQLG